MGPYLGIRDRTKFSSSKRDLRFNKMLVITGILKGPGGSLLLEKRRLKRVPIRAAMQRERMMMHRVSIDLSNKLVGKEGCFRCLSRSYLYRSGNIELVMGEYSTTTLKQFFY